MRCAGATGDEHLALAVIVGALTVETNLQRFRTADADTWAPLPLGYELDY